MCVEGGGVISSIAWSPKKASRVAKVAYTAEIMAAPEAGDEGHGVRNIQKQLLGLGINKVELHGVPGDKQVADILTMDMSSNQVEGMKTRKVFGGRIRSFSPKKLKTLKRFLLSI